MLHVLQSRIRHSNFNDLTQSMLTITASDKIHTHTTYQSDVITRTPIRDGRTDGRTVCIIIVPSTKRRGTNIYIYRYFVTDSDLTTLFYLIFLSFKCKSVFEKGCFDMLPVYIKYMGNFYNSFKKKLTVYVHYLSVT